MITLAATLIILIETDDCNAEIRKMSELYPNADLFCQYPDPPEYVMRPKARPEGLGL